VHDFSEGLFRLVCDDTAIDHCATNNGNCSADASCTNSVGSVTCICLPGYTGDGLTCTGKSFCIDVHSYKLQCDQYKSDSLCVTVILADHDHILTVHVRKRSRFYLLWRKWLHIDLSVRFPCDILYMTWNSMP